MDVHSALKGSGLPQPDAEILLSASLGKSRAWIVAHSREELPTEIWMNYQALLERRRAHEPVAYIIGAQEFYGRIFHVDRRVLIPRPATEGLVGLALDALQKPSNEAREVDSGIVAASMMFPRNFKKEISLVADIGTGSGAIAVTLALERPDLRVIATDISEDALEVARANAKKHNVFHRIEFRLGDSFTPLQSITEPFLIVCNPPYIPKARKLMTDVERFEPHIALYGGNTGTDLLKRVLHDASLCPPCLGIVVESEKQQVEELRDTYAH